MCLKTHSSDNAEIFVKCSRKIIEIIEQKLSLKAEKNMNNWKLSLFNCVLCSFLPSVLQKQQRRNSLSSLSPWLVDPITSSKRQNFENPHLLTRTHWSKREHESFLFNVKLQICDEQVWKWIIEMMSGQSSGCEYEIDLQRLHLNYERKRFVAICFSRLSVISVIISSLLLSLLISNEVKI